MISREPTLERLAIAQQLLLEPYGLDESHLSRVMAHIRAHKVDDAAEKARAMDGFVDRFYPGRSALLRPPSASEIKATTFIKMEIEEAAAKIRDTHVGDEDEDYELPSWAARYQVRQVVGEAEPCPRQHPDAMEAPPGMEAYRPGRTLDEIMTDTARYAEKA